MKFLVALNWRGFQSNQQFEDILKVITKGSLDQIDIPLKERELPFLETAADELRHELLLKYYRQYLDDEGVIYKNSELNLQHTRFHFLISDGPTYFNISDSPSIVFERSYGVLQGIMPITPRILLTKNKCINNSDMYYISHITDRIVERYNTTIRENASEFLIHIRQNPSLLEN